MSGYNGRRAPNFSQYLSELNAVPPSFHPTDQGLFDGDAELAMFTNAQFLDFDSMDSHLSAPPPPVGPELDEGDRAQDDQEDVKYLDMLSDFKVPNYPYFSSQVLPGEQSDYPNIEPQSNNNNNNNSNNSKNNIQPAPAPAPIQTAAPTSATQPPASATTSSGSPQKSTASGRSPTSQTGANKRKQDSSALDDAARLAQEEDKRRRNTAASARFRIKKKEREKNLERSVKEVTAKNSSLESRVAQLEMENRWLRNLITEKNDSTISDGDLSGMFNKFRESNNGQKAGQKTESS